MILQYQEVKLVQAKLKATRVNLKIARANFRESGSKKCAQCFEDNPRLSRLGYKFFAGY